MVSDLNLIQRLEEMRVNGRDIYEVANQLGGYVGPDTERRLADFLIREAKAASDLADEIVRLTAALAEARDKALEEAADEIGKLATAMGRIAEHPEASQKKAKAAIDMLEVAETIVRALKEKP